MKKTKNPPSKPPKKARKELAPRLADRAQYAEIGPGSYRTIPTTRD